MTASWRAPALMLLLIAGLYVAARPWLIDSLGGPRLAALVVGVSLFVGVAIAWWQARTRRYECPACQHVFGRSMLRHLASQNWFGRLRTHCPSCGEHSWCDYVQDQIEE